MSFPIDRLLLRNLKILMLTGGVVSQTEQVIIKLEHWWHPQPGHALTLS